MLRDIAICIIRWSFPRTQPVVRVMLRHLRPALGRRVDRLSALDDSVIVVKALRLVLGDRLDLEALSLFHHAKLSVLLEAAPPLPSFVRRVAIFIRHLILLCTDVFLYGLIHNIQTRSDVTASHFDIPTLRCHRS